MSEYMEQIKRMLIIAEMPGIEEWDTDDTVFNGLQAYIKSLQDIACKADTWRLSSENWLNGYRVSFDALQEIAKALIDSEDVPTDESDTKTPDSIVSTVKLALEYLRAARHSASLYSGQLEELRRERGSVIAERIRELEKENGALRAQVDFQRDSAKHAEAYSEGLASALRIVLDATRTSRN